MMILVERFLEAKDGFATESSTADRMWHVALGVLKSYGVLTDSVTRCVAVLEIFSERLFLDNGNLINRNTAKATHSHDIDCDWDSLWAMSNPLGQESSLTDPSLYPFPFDDFLFTDSMSAPFAQTFGPTHI